MNALQHEREAPASWLKDPRPEAPSLPIEKMPQLNASLERFAEAIGEALTDVCGPGGVGATERISTDDDVRSVRRLSRPRLRGAAQPRARRPRPVHIWTRSRRRRCSTPSSASIPASIPPPPRSRRASAPRSKTRCSPGWRAFSSGRCRRPSRRSRVSTLASRSSSTSSTRTCSARAKCRRSWRNT